MTLGFSKDQQLERGTPPGRRKKQAEKTAVQKGIDGEKETGEALSFGKGYRRNHQGRAGGGISNGDVAVRNLRGWQIEAKNTQTLAIPEWWRNLKAECPVGKRPLLSFNCEGERLIAIKIGDVANFAQDICEMAGAEVLWP